MGCWTCIKIGVCFPLNQPQKSQLLSDCWFGLVVWRGVGSHLPSGTRLQTQIQSKQQSSIGERASSKAKLLSNSLCGTFKRWLSRFKATTNKLPQLFAFGLGRIQAAPQKTRSTKPNCNPPPPHKKKKKKQKQNKKRPKQATRGQVSGSMTPL